MGIIKAAKGAAKVAKVANDIRKGDTGSTEDVAREALTGAADIVTGMIPGGRLIRRAAGRHIEAGIDAGAGAIARGIAQGVETGMPAIAEGLRQRAFREGHGGPAPQPSWDPFGSGPYSGGTGSVGRSAPATPQRSSSSDDMWDPYGGGPVRSTPATEEPRRRFGRRGKQEQRGGGSSASSSADWDPFGDSDLHPYR